MPNHVSHSYTAAPMPTSIYVWLVRSEEVLDQPGSWRIRKWDIEPFPEANFELSQPRGPSGRIELGCPGHFIAVRSCNWRRHTQVGNYRVSSIGDYFPERGGKRETIGAGDTCFFETMVFKTLDSQDENNEGCGCRQVAGWSEVDSERYATAGEAQAGHERYVEKYMRHATTGWRK